MYDAGVLDPRSRQRVRGRRRDGPGISPDPVAKVKRFHAKQSLNFTLLADADHAVCDAYGVWVQKSMYGKIYWGAQRSTYVVDADGIVVHVIAKASPKEHDDVVLAALGDLAS